MTVDGKQVDIVSLEDYRLPPLGHAISGAVGSTIANLFIYPLDMTEDGLRGIYAGLGADTLATVLSSFIYFYCYTALRNVQEKLNQSLGKTAQLNIAQELFLGAEAALISRLFTTPVSNVTTRLQTAGKQETRKGFLETVRDIHAEKGIRGFWTATMITYPFIFVRTSMVGSSKSEEKGKLPATEQVKKGMLDILKDAIQRDGPAGVYKGMRAQIIKGFFNQGIMYMIKDYVASYLTVIFYASLKLKVMARQNALN
ncbi:hypothetical protein DFQ28_005389 [Apophysomyces sp. BC1034]|nr:hypothetical protein DFQ28_005389 [Apophysomyces sp. BC1034]